VRAAVRRGPETTLPPLRVRPVAGQEERGARRDAGGVDPQDRVIGDEPVPVKQRARSRKKPHADDDEDLLP
jgi:hypothetical protein